MMELIGDLKGIFVLIHSFAAGIGVGAATVTDVFFFKFLKDFKISKYEASILNVLSQVIWGVLIVILLTGLLIYLPQTEVLNASSKFLTKMLIVLVIIMNGLFLNFYIAPRLIHISFGERHKHMPGEFHHIRKIAFALGAVSITSWYSAFLLGSLRSIDAPFISLVSLYVAVLAAAILGSQIMERVYSRRASE